MCSAWVTVCALLLQSGYSGESSMPAVAQVVYHSEPPTTPTERLPGPRLARPFHLRARVSPTQPPALEDPDVRCHGERATRPPPPQGGWQSVQSAWAELHESGMSSEL